MRKFFFILGLILLWPRWLPALTVSEIKTGIRRCVLDNPTNTNFRRYSDALLLSFINEAQTEIVNVTWLAEKTSSYALSPNTTYYKLPSDLIVVHYVYYKNNIGQNIVMEEVSQKGLYDANPMWERNTSGSPFQYWVSDSTNPANQQAAPKNISYIPILSRTSTGTVTIWYYSQEPDLVSDSDVPFENRLHLKTYHYAIVYHVSSRLMEMEGKYDRATAYQNRYIGYLGLIQNKLGQMPGFHGSIEIPSNRK